MKQSLFDALTQLIEIVWRRRQLIAVPLLAALPLGFLAGQFLPQTFASRALLALQENGQSNPLAQPETNGERDIKDRAPGLEALVKSDRVMVAALRDVLGDAMPTDPRKIAMAVADLGSHLQFEMIGNNFLEIKLTGASRNGLGRQLEAITSRFLETLVSPEQDALSATQLVLERHRDAVKAAEKALLLYKSQLGERALAAIASGEEQAKTRKIRLDAAISDLAALDEQIDRFRSALGAAPERAGERDGDIRAATASADALEAKRSTAATTEAQMARARAQQLQNLQAMEQRSAAQHKALGVEAADLARLSADDRSPASELRRLGHDVEEAQAAFDAYSQRFPAALSDRALQVLSAPERIRVIDAPKDPEFPTLSRSKIVVATALVCVMLAVLLAAIAELLDQRLRHPSEFEAVAGAPVIARVPRVRLAIAA